MPLSTISAPTAFFTHPSAGFYLVCNRLGQGQSRFCNPRPWEVRDFITVDRETSWSNIYARDGSILKVSQLLRQSAIKIQHRKNRQFVPMLATIETSEYSDSPGWQALRRVLDEYFEMVSEAKYLEDPDAAWKDRLDPEYHHPRWRIIVRHWRLKSEPRPSGSADRKSVG